MKFFSRHTHLCIGYFVNIYLTIKIWWYWEVDINDLWNQTLLTISLWRTCSSLVTWKPLLFQTVVRWDIWRERKGVLIWTQAIHEKGSLPGPWESQWIESGFPSSASYCSIVLNENHPEYDVYSISWGSLDL